MTVDEFTEEMKVYIERARKCRVSIAKSICDVGSYLHCRKCGWSEMLTESQAAEYLGSGWPEHCGQTMEIRR